MTAESTPVGLKEPLDGRLHGISSLCASEIDRFAVRAFR